MAIVQEIDNIISQCDKKPNKLKLGLNKYIEFKNGLSKIEYKKYVFRYTESYSEIEIFIDYIDKEKVEVT